MARSPNLAVVQDAFDDLIAEEAVEDIVEDKDSAVSVDDILPELQGMVEDAVEFMASTIIPEWTSAEAFFNGETTIRKVENRSQATKTVVRDAIRSLKPNLMRVFTQYPAICTYSAADVLDFATATVAQGQTSYVNQLFWSSGGYLALSNANHNALLKKVGILKAYFAEKYSDEYVVITSVTEDQLEYLESMEDVTIVKVEETGSVPVPPSPDMPEGGVTPLFRVEAAHRTKKGKLAVEDVPLSEFFVDEGATCPADAEVIGQRRSVTVGYARSIGLEYDGDWLELSDYDVERDVDMEGSEKRRGYMKTRSPDTSVDESKHKFLLTEVYSRFDLDGTGIPQLYRFWLGGESYELLDYERVSDNPYGVLQCDPIPGSFFGRSIYDVLKEDQDTQTSLLRATCDNAHLANNRRLAFHDTLVNQQDVLNPAIGAPIRFRQAGQIQEIGIESTLGTMLPLLQYLEDGSQNKVGVTNASMGLDPDALQSTDKDAARNTIQLAQGQVELICRNIAETGLRDVFTKLLKLSLVHKPREQSIFVNGIALPIDQAIFDPEMRLEVSVGMGTGNVESRLAALNMVAAKQQEIIAQYGLANPVCGLNHMMNTIVDMGSLMGINNMGRYFTQVTPEITQQLDEMAKAAAEASQPEKPSTAIAIAEEIRAKAKIEAMEMEGEQQREKQDRDTIMKTTELMLKDDLSRDKLAQEREIAELRYMGEQIDALALAQEQGATREYGIQQQLLKIAAERAGRREQQREQANMLQIEQQMKAQMQQGPQGQQGQQGNMPQGSMPQA